MRLNIIPYVEALYRYPRGLEGFARLLLRSALAILLISHGYFDIFTRNPGTVSVIRIVLCLGLCLGFSTSILGIFATLLSLWALFLGHLTLPLVQVAALILSVAIAILGPGAYSVDALLFGRLRVIF